MPSNLDLVRSIYAAWERGDFTCVDWADPEIEYVVMDGPEPGIWMGVAGMAEYVRDFLSVVDDWRNEAEEYRAISDGRVVVLDRLRGRGRISGLDVGRMKSGGAHVFEIEDGRVTRLGYYNDRVHAFTDLGLTEEDEPL